jgi:hypothetical protein
MTPSAVAPIVATATQGETVAVSEQVDIGWRTVTLADGRGGYIADGEVRVIGASPTARFASSGPPASGSPTTIAPARARPSALPFA